MSSVAYYTAAIVALVVITIAVIAMLATFYYLGQISSGRTMTSTQASSLRIFVIVTAVMLFLLWLLIIYVMFELNNVTTRVVTH